MNPNVPRIPNHYDDYKLDLTTIHFESTSIDQQSILNH